MYIAFKNKSESISKIDWISLATSLSPAHDGINWPLEVVF